MRLSDMKSFFNGYKSIGALVFSLLTAIIMLLAACGDNEDVTSAQNHPPIVPQQPNPADGTVNQDLGERLEWYCYDEDGDPITYDFYIGTSSPPVLVDTLDTYMYNHERFEYEMTYYWKVVAKDDHGHVISSPVWSFTTGRLFLVDNFATTNNMHKVFVREDSMVFVIDDNLGLRIMDVTDTSQVGVRIDSVGTVSLQGFNYDVFVVDNYAYAVTAAGIFCYNVSIPATPTRAFATDSLHFSELDEPRAINVIGDYAYVAVATADSNGIVIGSVESSLRILNISDTSNIILEATYVYDGIASDIYVADNYAYIADSTAGLQVFDVTDPGNPTLAADYGITGIGLGVYVKDDTAYFADGPAGLLILNVADPSNPILIGSYDTPGSARDVSVYSGKAFIADYWNGGLQILDISDAANPVLFASRDTQGGASGVFADNNFIYFTDRWAGLLLFEYIH